jgi:two-component system LytT family response regulator
LNTALIIDDNQKARDFLNRDLGKFCPELKILGEANGVVSGLKAIKKHKPEIVFLDIHMEDGTGFDILELLNDVPFKVIFTTASDAHALQAFKFSAIDYLLKPIDPDELIAAVTKAVKGSAPEKETVGLLKSHLNKKSENDLKKIALHTAEKIQICDIKDIIRCEADINYTHFSLKGGSSVLVTKTLKHFNQLLSPAGFFRVHQSHLINLAEVKEYVKADGGYIVMTNGDRVPVSSRKKSEVIGMITNNHG